MEQKAEWVGGMNMLSKWKISSTELVGLSIFWVGKQYWKLNYNPRLLREYGITARKISWLK